MIVLCIVAALVACRQSTETTLCPTAGLTTVLRASELPSILVLICSDITPNASTPAQARPPAMLQPDAVPWSVHTKHH